MNPLIELHHYIRKTTAGEGTAMALLAVQEIEQQKEIILIYEQLWGKLPEELQTAVRNKVFSRNANDVISFSIFKRKIEEYVDKLKGTN